jgi:cell wall-associated NlpC family hydrolase
MRRVEGADRGVVRDLQASRERMARARRGLIRARRAVRAEVAIAARQRAAIEAVLAERRALLARSQGQLAILERVERQRAAAMYRIAQARVARMLAEQRAVQTGPGALLAAPARAGGELAPSGLPGAGPGLALGADSAAPVGSAGIGRPDVVGYAMQLIGTPYRWGGASPAGFDCSGFVNYVYAHFGKSLPHYTGAQWGSGAQVSPDQLEPGDLVFFDGLGHDGIYIGGGQFIHSPHTGDSVKISSLGEGWYGKRYVGAVRPAFA